jgi:1,3-beta-glucanosyltransferase GAS1
MLVSLRPAVIATAVATLLASRVAAIPKVTRTGRYLYQDDGTRFYIKGIAYQEQGEVVASDDNEFLEPSTFIDPLAIPDACTRDVEYLRQAAINTVRVYSVNSSLDHDACMRTFSDAGIYTM